MFVAIVSIAPSMKRLMWKFWYNLIAKYDKNEMLTLMNYGYFENNKSSPAFIKPQLKLYEHVVEGINLDSKVVLEIGAGRSAGAAHLSKSQNPSIYIALDMAARAGANSVTNDAQCIKNVTGDALVLPIQPSVVDIIVNVESSHCYTDFEAFITQVALTLKKGGVFCCCDLMTPNQVEKTREMFKKHNLVVTSDVDITQNILNSLERGSGQHKKLIESHVPWYLRKVFYDFAGIKGAGVYRLFETGKYVYYSFQAKKA